MRRIGDSSSCSTVAVLAWPMAAATPTAKPEEVGFSSERLQRINELVQRHIEAGSFSGAVTLVARNGRIAHLEAHGLMDVEARKPMQKDAIFRIMSMTKPVVGVSIMMMIEEGKVRLTDPVSKFIPELKDLKVAVPMAGAPGGAAGRRPRRRARRAALLHRARRARDHDPRSADAHVGSRQRRRQQHARRGRSRSRARRRWPTTCRASAACRSSSSRARAGPTARRPASTCWRASSRSRRGCRSISSRRQRIFDPLGMKDTFFYPAEGNPRLVTRYARGRERALEKQGIPNFMNGVYFSGGGGLMSTAEDYLQFAQMLLNGGELNGKRLLSPRTVEMMGSVHAPDTLPGRPRGEGYGLSVRVVNDPVARNSFLSQGSFGWSGAYGTHFWVDPKEKIVGVLMTQTPNQRDPRRLRERGDVCAGRRTVRQRHDLAGTH